ncbi:sigma-70 family RNA polymerase sigma factor [Peribacillus cavernae]|uniref:Sigma-70 family RNA polymerase sigma factor n=1 Tax=Peribacillus cavernae TaxID=1674310 RepID=A0A3S0VU20_9BACI|nr:sigma-70 family RNA polymerase sigma factor [Peribacillus cavernae]MDQ0218116.1 DNA-directed RNA polymerase [Peribacillus cavernae]RUQ32729.1 sigma-70 family RNA polymerase sigma factor [Peribacillus cavernae]
MDDFSKLADQYTPMIHHIIKSLSIYKNKEEFFQVGLIGLWEAQSKFDPTKGKFLSYAYGNVKGRILNELKKEHLLETRNTPLEFESNDFGEEIPIRDEPLQPERLQSYCEGLTKNQSKWVMLTFQEDKSLTEIAEQLGVSVAAVKSWRQSALKKLRKNWAAYST